MVLRICELVISSLKTSPAGTNGFTAETVAVASETADDGDAAEDGEKFSISFLTILPFYPEPFTCAKSMPLSWAIFLAKGEANILSVVFVDCCVLLVVAC